MEHDFPLHRFVNGAVQAPGQVTRGCALSARSSSLTQCLSIRTSSDTCPTRQECSFSRTAVVGSSLQLTHHILVRLLTMSRIRPSVVSSSKDRSPEPLLRLCG